jgi:hypothetical protein
MSVSLELIPQTDILKLEVEFMHVELYLLPVLGKVSPKGLALDYKEEGKEYEN